MNTARIVIVLAFVVVLAGCFLPWVSSPVGSFAGTEDGGWIPMGLMVPAFLLGILGNRSRGLGVAEGIVVMLLALAAIAFMVVKMSQGVRIEEVQGWAVVDSATYGLAIGVWVTLAGSVLGVVGGYLGMKV